MMTSMTIPLRTTSRTMMTTTESSRTTLGMTLQQHHQGVETDDDFALKNINSTEDCWNLEDFVAKGRLCPYHTCKHSSSIQRCHCYLPISDSFLVTREDVGSPKHETLCSFSRPAAARACLMFMLKAPSTRSSGQLLIRRCCEQYRD